MKRQVNNDKKHGAFSVAPTALRTLIVVLALLIVVVGAISASYSWFTPGTDSGSAMKLVEETVAFRSHNCTLVTYDEGTTVVDSKEYTLTPGEIKYFTTTITNTNGENSTNVSLYATNVIAGMGIGVSRPDNNYKKYSSGASDKPIMRNAYISAKDSAVVGSGYVDVVWFIKNIGNSNISFTMGKIKPYITYN